MKPINALTRYAHDLIEIQCKNLVFILPSDGSMTLLDFRQLQVIVFDLEPSFSLTIQALPMRAPYDQSNYVLIEINNER